MIKLNSVDKVAFPTSEKWGEFYAAWFDSLVESLGTMHSACDREEAVANAFVKLMGYSEEDYASVPDTEKDWWGCIRWQAKADLSHVYESRVTREKYHKLATDERQLMGGNGVSYCGIDSEVGGKAAFETLYGLCREAKMKPENVEAYVRWYLNGENSDEVSRDLGITVNNLYMIRFRIEKLLGEKGKSRYVDVRNRLFLEAA